MSCILYGSSLFGGCGGPEKDRLVWVFEGAGLATKTVQSTTLAFQCVDYVHGCDCLAFSMFGVGHCISDNIL